VSDGAFGLGADKGYVQWHRTLFDSLRIGGVWGIPRCGLVFTRTGEASFALTDVMPHDPAMPITAAELLAQQGDDYAGVKLYMTQAGITVTDSTNTF
jgi:hypothetical protein